MELSYGITLEQKQQLSQGQIQSLDPRHGRNT